MRLRSVFLGAVLALSSWAASAQIPFVWGASQGPARYTVLANDFDGTNDYLTRGADLTGIADSDKGTFSAWVRIDGGDATSMRLISTGTTNVGLVISRNASNVFAVNGTSTLDVQTLVIVSTNTYAAGASWIHLLAAWDKAAGTSQMYINGTSDNNTGAGVNVIGNLDLTEGEFSVGALTNGGQKWNGCMTEVYFATTYLDISNSTNRAKFRTASGRPADLGNDCSLPTGSQPILCLRGQSTTNVGSGQGMTVTGALDTCPSSPTD